MLLLSQNHIYKYNKDCITPNKIMTYVTLIKTRLQCFRVAGNLEGDYVTIGNYYHIL